MTLPPEISPWAPWLAELAAPLALEVGRLARKLDAAIGPMRPRKPEPGGEPDGYRGLVRRGPFERLLLSEWAYLDEVPDEFIRRVAQHEQGFYELDHRSPRAGLRCEAVFDAGPASLGSPRIAHVALLVVLARRAQAANAEFGWRVAQSPTVAHDRVDGPQVRALLAARSGSAFVAPEVDPALDEAWFVGGPAVRAHGFRRGVACVIEDVVDPAREELEVSVERPGRLPVRLSLALPPVAQRRALIIDPTSPARASPRPGRSPRGDEWRAFPNDLHDPVELRFVPGTAQLQVFFAAGPFLTWSLAHIDQRKVPRARVDDWPTADGLVAAGYAHQRSLVVTRRIHDELGLFGHGLAAVCKPPKLPAPGRGAVIPVTGSPTREHLFLDGTGACWSFRNTADRMLWSCERIAASVAELMPDAEGAWAFVRGDAGTWELAFVHGHQHAPPAAEPERGLAMRTQVGVGRVWVLPPWGALPSAPTFAVLDGQSLRIARLWQGPDKNGARRPAFRLSDPLTVEGEIVGAAVPAGNAPLTAITHDVAKGGFRRSHDRAFLPVPRLPVQTVVSPDGELVAFISTERTVEVWAFEGQRPVLLRHEAAT